MAGDKLTQKRNIGPEPIEAEPNHVRETTYEAPNVPRNVIAENQKLPEKTAEDKVGEDMPVAVDEVKKRL